MATCAATCAGLLAGESVLCFALSEPDASGDVWGLAHHRPARGRHMDRGRDEAVGSRGPFADFAVLFAVSDRDRADHRNGGITAWWRRPPFRGVRISRSPGCSAGCGGDEALMSFTDVKVPAGYVLGEPDEGAAIAASGAPTGALYTAGRFVGLGRWALARAVSSPGPTRRSAARVAENDTTLLALADSAIELRGRRHGPGVRRAPRGRRCGGGRGGHAAGPRGRCLRPGVRAVPGHSRRGRTGQRHRLYDGWHQAAIVRTAEGIAQPTRHAIARRLLDGDAVDVDASQRSYP